MPTTPTAPASVPDFPAMGDASFNSKAYSWAQHMRTTFPAEMDALADTTYANAVEAEASSASAAANAATSTTKATEAGNAAAAAAAAAGASSWTSGAAYIVGQVVWSPLDLQTYRRKTNGVGTTDPSIDETNWQLLTGGVTFSGTQTLTNKTLTSPRIGTAFLDTNGNELFSLTATASAVNEITVANAAAANSPSLQASGGDTNIGLNLATKGTGLLSLFTGTNRQLVIGTIAGTAVNYVLATGSATGNAVALAAAGSDSNISITITPKGTGLTTIAAPESTGAIYDNGSVRSNITAVGALNIDCSLGNYFTKTINGNSTFTVSNVPASRAYAFTLELTHTSGTVTWFSGVQWPGGNAPTLNTAKVHLFTFITDDGGISWRGAYQVNYNS